MTQGLLFGLLVCEPARQQRILVVLKKMAATAGISTLARTPVFTRDELSPEVKQTLCVHLWPQFGDEHHRHQQKLDDFKSYFNAMDMKNIANFQVLWTNNLAEHLLVRGSFIYISTRCQHSNA